MSRKPDRCSIARSLEVLGERWTLLVVREALRGRTRFAEFRDALGVAPDVLTTRLRTLVDAGVLERRAYREPGSRERHSYHLTPDGLRLRLVLGALQQWGDARRPDDDPPPALLRERESGKQVRVVFSDPDGAEIDCTDVESVFRR
jgi:DNA-binding HxlR family transcriptional regulator